MHVVAVEQLLLELQHELLRDEMEACLLVEDFEAFLIKVLKKVFALN